MPEVGYFRGRKTWHGGFFSPDENEKGRDAKADICVSPFTLPPNPGCLGGGGGTHTHTHTHTHTQ